MPRCLRISAISSISGSAPGRAALAFGDPATAGTFVAALRLPPVGGSTAAADAPGTTARWRRRLLIVPVTTNSTMHNASRAAPTQCSGLNARRNAKLSSAEITCQSALAAPTRARASGSSAHANIRAPASQPRLR
jgi:hypothetical protein